MATTVEPVEPKKTKSWVALIGGALTVVIPLLLQVSEWLPQPWPAVVGGLVALLTAIGVYQAPYKPKNSVVVPAPPAVNPDGTYQKGW